MANNIISDWLETYALYSDTPEQEAATRYAAQLDRLVEAAGDAVLLLSACDDAPSKSAAAALRTILREIELPSEVK